MGRAALVVPFIAVTLMAFSAGAQPRADAVLTPCSDDDPTAAATQRGPVSLAQAQQMAVQRFPGRVVRAETVGQGNRRVHQIRILDSEGRVRNVRIDAQTGAFL